MFSVLGASAVLLPAAALWLAAQALQPQPIAAPGAPLAISDLNAARRLISREVLSQAFQGEPLTLALTASQAQALAQDMGARVLHAPSSLHLSEQQADLAVSLPIRQTPLRALHPLGDWLNVRVRLSAPPRGAPVLQAVQVGELKVPPALALWAAQRIAEARGLRSMAELGLAAIETVLDPANGGPRTPDIGGRARTRDLGRAVAEALHDRNRARTLFATHYHELARLEERLEHVSNLSMRAREWNGELVFLHEAAPGAADPDVTRWPYTKRRTPFWPKVADPWK